MCEDVIVFTELQVSLIDCLLTAVESTVPTLTHVIPSEGRDRDGVSAVTSLGDDVFVLRRHELHVTASPQFMELVGFVV